jgi:hypothetical protein
VLKIIPAKRGASDEPRVSVTAPKSSKQTRVAFNGALVQKAKLTEFGYVGLEFDEKRKKLRFVPSASFYEGQPAHRLLNDGGNNKTPSRIVLLPRGGLEFLVPRAYEPVFVRDGRSFEIELAGPT